MKQILIGLVRIYQSARTLIAFLLGGQYADCCRFIPTCSDYAAEALQKHGALQGLKLTVKRLLKCHPLGNFGYDPVPQGGRRG